MTTGNYAQHWHDDGRGGCFCYGLVTKAGEKQFYVTWESGTHQRFPQGSHNVTQVPPKSLDIARESLKKAGLVKESATITDQPCPRCGCTDGQHTGFHEDAELPIKKGDRVRIRAGAEIWSTLPDPKRKRFTLSRSRVITVHSMDCGQSKCIGYAPEGAALWQPQDNPGVCWTGTGGYWHHAKLSDVTLVRAASQGVPAVSAAASCATTATVPSAAASNSTNATVINAPSTAVVAPPLQSTNKLGLLPITVHFSEDPEHVFNGYTNGRHWNGFACPHLELDELRRVLELLVTWGDEVGFTVFAEEHTIHVQGPNGDNYKMAAQCVTTIEGDKWLFDCGGAWTFVELSEET